MKFLKQEALISYTFQAIISGLSRPRAGIVTQVTDKKNASKPLSWQGLTSLSSISLGTKKLYN